MGAMPRQLVELGERAVVEQVVDPLAGGHLAPLVLALNRPLGPGVERRFLALGELGQPLGHGMEVLRHDFEATGTPAARRGGRACPNPLVARCSRTRASVPSSAGPR